jgi:hypothetical protein
MACRISILVLGSNIWGRQEAIAARAKELIASGLDLYLFFKHEDDPSGALHAEKVLRVQQGIS